MSSNPPSVRCDAEAPYADTVAFCRLPDGHFTRWHEGYAEDTCSDCGRRECHTDLCPDPSADGRIVNVRWEGPCEPMPEMDVWVRLGMERMRKALDAGERKTVNGKAIVEVQKADLIFDLVMGTPALVRDFMDQAEEWGRALCRDIDLFPVSGGQIEVAS